MNAFLSQTRRGFLSSAAAAAVTGLAAPQALLATYPRVGCRAAISPNGSMRIEETSTRYAARSSLSTSFSFGARAVTSSQARYFKHWQQMFERHIADGQLVLVKIHTVFEGHSYQTVRRLRSYLKEKQISLPVGVDRRANGQRLPETMRSYRTRGTPEIAVIDRDGIIRFQEFGYFEPQPVEVMIQSWMTATRA